MNRAHPILQASLLLLAALLLAVGCAGTREEVKPVQAQPVAAAPPPELSADDLVAEGLKALKAKDLANAKADLERALAKDPKIFVAHYDLGVMAQLDSQLDAAAKSYESALEIDPDHEAAILNLGKVYRDQQAWPKGIALFEKAVAKKPFDVNYLNNLSAFFRLSKKYDDAIKTVRKLLSRTKDNPDAYKNLALIAYDQDQLRLAEFIGANAKKLDDKDPGVYNNLGLVYVKLGDRRLALAQFKKAVDLDKNFSPGYANLGALALSFRDYDNAAHSFETVTRLDPNNSAAHLSLAWSYEGMRLKDGTHRAKDAVLEFEKVLGLVKNQPDAVYGIARAYAGELKDLPRAKEFYERFLPIASGAEKDKAQKELAALEVRIKAGAEQERMKKEQEEKKKKEDEAKRQKALEAEKKGGSMLDKVTDQAEKDQPQEAPKETPAETPKDDGKAAPAPDASKPQPDAKPGAAPAKTEPAKAEPAKAEPAKTEPAKTEPAKAESAKTTPAKAEPAKTEPAKTEPAKAEPAKTAPAKAEPAKAEPAKTEPAKTEPAKTEPAKTEPAKPEPAKTEPAKADAGLAPKPAEPKK